MKPVYDDDLRGARVGYRVRLGPRTYVRSRWGRYWIYVDVVSGEALSADGLIARRNMDGQVIVEADQVEQRS